ncbi:auxin response factor 17-like [Trifolium pratense]|uniref:auxin response factor 17-like n=1 Tax=Trifolium pratense TaxID=57577 RepID=UPI001E6956F4|nr:auxin response factor 17-like [Trifolium pratense]
MSPPQPRPVHPKIWQSCAGPAVTIPKLHSKVYYFPLGHLEHACPFPNPKTISIIHNNNRPYIPCIITAVDLLSDPHTDEVFAKLILTPITETQHVQEHPVVPDQEDDDDGGDKVVSYIKILTQSDSNNGGGFSVPRQCADLIFPELDFTDPMPSQQLYINEVHGGGVWKYTHVYRGKPKRHLFTTGWTPFVNGKKLVAGDTVVFLKNSTGNMFVGIRRNMKFAAPEAAASQKKKKEKVEGFSRNGKRGNVTEEAAVIEAVERAEKNMAFEVVYYPTPNWSDFVVEAKVVDEAMKIGWESGMRVKLVLKKEECSKKPLCQPQGAISNVSIVPNWRMLKVNWDEPEISQYPNCVNPWQVELISQVPALYLPFHQTKRPRLTMGEPFIPMIEFPCSTMESFNQTLLNCDSFPAGMQGARHDHLSSAASTSSNLLNYNGYGFFVNSIMAGMSTMPKEINIGSSTSVDSSSPHNNFGTNYVQTHNDNTERVKPSSIKLFGKTIHIVESSDFTDSGIKGSEDGSNGCSQIEVVDKICTGNAQ